MEKTELSLGDEVTYEGKVYIVLHIYDSNYIEIKDKDSFIVELVHISEIKIWLYFKREKIFFCIIEK